MGPSIKGLLSQFTVKEMSHVVPVALEGMEWVNVKREIARLKFRMSSKELATVGSMLFQARTQNKNSTQNAIWCLQLFLAALKKKHTWYCHQMMEQRESVTISSIADLLANLMRRFNEHGLEVEVKTLMLDNIIWLMYVNKRTTKSGKERYGSIAYCVYKPNTEFPHIFTNSISVPNSEIFAATFGFASLKYVNLFGRDVAGMYNMLERKHHLSLQLDVPNYIPRDILKDNRSIISHREEYANCLLPGNTPIYQLWVRSKSRWLGTTYIPQETLGLLEIAASLRFVSGNSQYTVEDMMRHMISLGIITTPSPIYIRNLGCIMKNQINLKSKSLHQ